MSHESQFLGKMTVFHSLTKQTTIFTYSSIFLSLLANFLLHIKLNFWSWMFFLVGNLIHRKHSVLRKLDLTMTDKRIQQKQNAKTHSGLGFITLAA